MYMNSSFYDWRRLLKIVKKPKQYLIESKLNRLDLEMEIYPHEIELGRLKALQTTF